MVRYATALSGDPEAVYRQVDSAGRTAAADPHALVSLLYDEAIHALRAAAHAVEHRRYELKSRKITRATAILFALEAGLDFDSGGEVAKTLATLYDGSRRSVVRASMGHDPAPLLVVADNLAEIADAWRQVRAA